MAIKNRRGEYANFDPYKMLQGEWGITTSGDPNSADGKSVYMCFAAGNVKRMATYDDMVENIDRATEEVQERLTQEVREATAEANSTIQKATQATQSANTAADRANDAAEAAESYVLGDISGKTVTFEMALQRANIQSNDSLAVAFGKLAKFCADLDDHAFSAPVNNLLGTDPSLALAAPMGKTLDDKITALNFALDNKNKLLWAGEPVMSGQILCDTRGYSVYNMYCTDGVMLCGVKIYDPTTGRYSVMLGAAGGANNGAGLIPAIWYGLSDIYDTHFYLFGVSMYTPQDGGIYNNKAISSIYGVL